MLVYGFRFYFTPLTGVLFAFPSRYCFPIGSCLVFSLGSWSTLLPARFLVPRRTQVPHQRDIYMSRTGISPSVSGLPKPFRYIYVFSQLFGSSPCGPTTPVKSGLGSSDFARRYFRNLRRIAPLLDFFSLSYLDGSLHLVSLYYPILFRYVMTTSLLPGYPIRLSGNLRMCASPPGFSQLTTAFFALQLPGIHHKPFSSLDHIIASASSFTSFPFPILCQDPLPSYL